MNILDFAGYHYNKRMDNSLTSKFVPDYYKLHRRRIELIYKQYQYWNKADAAKEVLAALYTRYIFLQSREIAIQEPECHMPEEEHG